MNSPVLPKDPRRIVILRPDHLGDLILFSGGLRHIRMRWPTAHITLVVRSYGRELFAHCPHVDELLPYEPLRWVGKVDWPLSSSSSSVVTKFLRSAVSAFLRLPRYDLAILAQIAPWVNHHRIMSMVQADSRLGTCGNVENQTPDQERRYRKLYSHQLDISNLSRALPELETNRLFLRFLGIDLENTANFPEFWTLPEHRNAAAELIPHAPGQWVLGIAPGVSSPTGKRLPAQWYLEAVKKMQVRGMHVVLLGAASDASDCEELELLLRQSDGACRVTNLAGKTSVLELIECVRRCDLLLCNDAAPLHIAAGLHKPVVGIMGGGHFGRFYPWGDPQTSRMVNKSMECYGCNWECKYDTLRCVQEIPPADAARELLHLLEGISRADVLGRANRQTPSFSSNQPRVIHGH